MVGPSATGSLNGTPSSIISAPASAAARTIFSLASSEGSPAVMKATIPSSPDSESSRKRRGILVSGRFAGRPGECACADFEMAGSDMAGEGFHVLVAPAGEVEDHNFIFLQFRR